MCFVSLVHIKQGIIMEKFNRRKFLKLTLLGAGGLAVGTFYGFSKNGVVISDLKYDDLLKFDWGYLVDTTRCIGCGSCVRACKVENNVPDNYYRTWVERYEIDSEKNVKIDSPNGALEGFKHNNFDSNIEKAFFVPKLCNQCYNSACTNVCPVGATFYSPDKIVLIDEKQCIGCGFCVEACPYGCRYIDSEKAVADKCNLCYHRIHKGITPACVNACPRDARIFGNLKDQNSKINKVLRERKYSVLKKELGTKPKCYYLGIDKGVV